MTVSEQLETCPYNPHHRINPNRFQLHLHTCRKKYLFDLSRLGKISKIKICRYNYEHHVTNIEEHEMTCEDKKEYDAYEEDRQRKKIVDVLVAETFDHPKPTPANRNETPLPVPAEQSRPPKQNETDAQVQDLEPVTMTVACPQKSVVVAGVSIRHVWKRYEDFQNDHGEKEDGCELVWPDDDIKELTPKQLGPQEPKPLSRAEILQAIMTRFRKLGKRGLAQMKEQLDNFGNFKIPPPYRRYRTEVPRIEANIPGYPGHFHLFPEAYATPDNRPGDGKKRVDPWAWGNCIEDKNHVFSSATATDVTNWSTSSWWGRRGCGRNY